MEKSTVRQMIEVLIAGAKQLPNGLDSELDVALCDGDNLRLIERSDLSVWHERNNDGTVKRDEYLMLRLHLHPDDEDNEPMRPATAEADEYLKRWSTEGEIGG